ncbi:MAG: hypothetical protein GY716_04625 [bacterium]|nr:hypothetical protein [bacterium]
MTSPDSQGGSKTGLAAAAACLYGFVALWVAYLVWLGPDERPHHYFSEGSPVDWVSSTFLLTSALLAWSTWFVDRGKPLRERAVWGVCALGFAVLGLDERFQFHERLDSDWLEPWLGDPTWIRSWNDLTVAIYFAVALAFVIVTLPTILRVRGFRELLGLGLGFFAVHNFIDMSFEHSSLKSFAEEAFKMLAGASFVLAFRQAYFARAAARRERPAPPGALRDIVVVVVLGIFAAVVLSGGAEWQKELAKKWGDPAAWPVATLLGASTILFLFVALRTQRAERWIWGLLMLSTGVFALDEMFTACHVSLNNRKVERVLPELAKDPFAVLHSGPGWPTLVLALWIAALVAAAVYAAREIRTRLIVAACLVPLPVLLTFVGSSSLGADLLDLLRIALAAAVALAAVALFEARVLTR